MVKAAPLPPENVGVELGASISALYAPDGDFDVTTGVKCGPKSIPYSGKSVLATPGACRTACAQQSSCAAAEYDEATGDCKLFRQCLWREAATRLKKQPSGRYFVRERTNRVSVMHRVGREWPVPATQVVWRANATLVVASYQSRLDWLRTLPPGLLDVALYHKHDYVANMTKATAGLYDERLPLHYMRDTPQWCYSSPKSKAGQLDHDERVGLTRVNVPLERCVEAYCECDEPLPRAAHGLAYYRVLPNYGRTCDADLRAPYKKCSGRRTYTAVEPCTAGGSREPYVYLRFLLDFWDNLPNVVVFSQDDCMGGPVGCPWAYKLPLLSSQLRGWRAHWGAPRRPARADCACHFQTEHTYNGRYYWFPWMHIVQQGVFNQTLANRPQNATVEWPREASFAVGAATVRATPRWVFELLLRLHVSEGWCHRGSIQWAHALERLWFEIFDPATPKLRTWRGSGGVAKHRGCLATAAGDT